MRTVIVTSMTTGYALPLLLGFAVAGRCLTYRVTGFLRDIAYTCRPEHPVITSGIWLFAMAGMLAMLAPVSLTERIVAVLMMAFLLQVGVTDALSGYLPLTFTGRFLVSGLLVGFITDTTDTFGTIRATDTVVMGGMMFIVHALMNRNIQRVGRGDLWLITGLATWMGMQEAALATLFGLAGFVLWQCTWHLSGKKEGPLGPWLCLSGGLFQLSHLYQPVWVLFQ
ncbi:prepilin peptidase [Enterobacter sp. SECR19-1250]|uniref:prepilin peptidase n=1 Tax=Enterobacter sp. SECR19-1250 TaxID=2749084 RepID=UPI0015B3F556|nr:prepilin peptidase [Enterobacter sp. SECR19-1250]NWJ78853.1 prepilin peptidase [Enterobacter sp. SECR19-1250]